MFERAGVAWDEVYKLITNALKTQKLQGVGGCCEELVTNEVVQIFANV